MAEKIREVSLGDTVVELEPGEKHLREIRADKGTYWRDHGVMAVLGMGVVGMVLALIGSDHVAIGSLGAVLALGVRGAYLYSEQMKFYWVLTNMRLVGPGGRQVYLLELETARRLFGDIQIITRGGDKHLIKHVAGAESVVAEINAARDKRARRKRG
ncbi:MAG: hypothetical protein JJU09_03775 [Rhodobacteraceae bacterium]|nr:hypothetical protein [Paracoccaceae bacterium]TVR49261.1 MAG: hypothetical protein EA386_02555 [Paracoccaceae bacterium]